MSRRYAITAMVVLAQHLVCALTSAQAPNGQSTGADLSQRYQQLEREMANMQAELQTLRLRMSALAEGKAQSNWAAATMFEESTDNPLSQIPHEPIPPFAAGYAQAAGNATPTMGSAAPVAHANYDAILTRLDALEQNSAKATAPKTAGDGWIDLSTEKWTVKMGGHIQSDYILWPEKDPDITSPLARNYFEFRRLRLTADGTGYGVYDFRLQMTLEPENVGQDPNIVYLPTVKDAYFSINDVPWLGRIRFGNFFVPFSLEQVTNDTNTVFLERAIPAQGTFTGGREVGIAQYNHNESKNFSWTTGFFFDNISDTGIDRIDNNQGYRISGRVVYLPYYDEPSNGRYLVHTGAGILYTHDQDQRSRFRARPQIHTGPFLIDTGNLNSEHFTIGNVELATVMGPLALQSELFYCDVDLVDQGNTPLYGAYFYGTYFLTGENRNYHRFGQHGAQFGRATPFSNVFWVPGCHSCGAWEFKARWSYLDFGKVDAGQYNDLTIGFNWYWSDRVRMLFDWIRPVTTSEAVFGATKSDIIGMRLDCNW